MSRESLIAEAIEAILSCDEAAAVDVAKRSLAEGVSPVDMLNGGFSAGIREMGERFGRGESFLPELILAASSMKAATDILNEAISAAGSSQKHGVMVIATVEGDVHDIGKGIVISLLKTQGIEVFDAGRDVPVDKIIEKALEVNADIIGTSALLTTTMINQKKLEETLRARDLRSRFKTMIGGAPCTKRWAEKIGADAYAEDAADAVNLALKMLEKA
jgi:trimethylamine corrinoid protein